MKLHMIICWVAVVCLFAGPHPRLLGSSHREAPAISQTPALDSTDFYFFQSYDPAHIGNNDRTVIISNFHPLQDAFGGPNYFLPNENAIYEIHIDNDADAQEDLTFRFTFQYSPGFRSIATSSGPVEIPLLALDTANFPGDPNLNVIELYNVTLVQAGSSPLTLTNTSFGPTFFTPPPYIGTKTLPNYETVFIPPHIFTLDNLPGGGTGRVFVGQREDPFAVNLGEVFDLINLDPLGPPNGEQDSLRFKNITSIILEVPTSLLTAGGDGSGIIGGWTTAKLPRDRSLIQPAAPSIFSDATHSGPLVQVSRLGNPLFNELLIGLGSKDLFNHSAPANDSQFQDFVTNSTMAAIINREFGTSFPTSSRSDLQQVFLTGVPGLNRPPTVVPAEMLRLNTAIPPVPRNQQDPLGFIGGDNAGFPNGRRPGDDVVDIALRLIGGALTGGSPPLNDGVHVDAMMFADTFPYLNTPIPGSPNCIVCLEIKSSATLPGPFDHVDGPVMVDEATDTVTLQRPAGDRYFFQGVSDVRLRTEIAVDATNVHLQFKRDQ